MRKLAIALIPLLMLALVAGAVGCGGEEDTTPTPTPVVTTPPAKTQSKIAFVSHRDDNMDIYVMNDDGSNEIRLTYDPDGDAYPSWSPDGTKILFSRLNQNYVMDADGSNEVRLTDWFSEGRGAWSPDGTRIAFDGGADVSDISDGNVDVYGVNPDGSNLTRLTDDPAQDRFVTWSVDGTKMLFQRTEDGTWPTYIMNSDGSNQSEFDPDVWPDYRWVYSLSSPDYTKTLSISDHLEGNAEIYVSEGDMGSPDFTDSDPINLTNNPADDDQPQWSPDGSKIVFRSNRDGDATEIYVMNADGSNQTRLTNNDYYDWRPEWSP